MKKTKILYLALFLAFLAFSCSDNNGATDTGSSIISGEWTIFSGEFSEGIIMQLEASFTLDENDGNITGNGEISYINNRGSNNITINLNESVTGTYQEESEPNIVLNIGGGAFIYSGNWVNVGENFIGTASFQFNNETLTEEDKFLINKSD
jgi:hypothetical protein